MTGPSDYKAFHGSRVKQAIERSKQMRLHLISLAALIMGLGLLSAVAISEVGVDSAKLASIEYSLEGQPETAAKLGLSGRKSFILPDIEAELLVVELFSMYCPHCQREAPRVNELYDMVKGMKDLDNKAQFLGIGLGNTPYETGLFAKKYGIEFPLVADAEVKTSEALAKRARTPTFLILKNTKAADLKVLYSEVGRIKDLSAFVDRIRAGL
jgi:peroxiredoxin